MTGETRGARSRPRWPAPEWLLFGLIALILVRQVLLPPIVGLADNGDFVRVLEPLGLQHAATEAPGPSFLVAELEQLATEVKGLGLPPDRALVVRENLLALARSVAAGPPAWPLMSEALGHAGATPAFARRALPLLLELVARAA